MYILFLERFLIRLVTDDDRQENQGGEGEGGKHAIRSHGLEALMLLP